MEKREIGKSGIMASGLALGCWAIGGGEWWGTNDDQMSVDTIHRAVELGIDWIDTARVYGFGHSEEVVGRALKELPRDQVIISTKCGLQWYDGGGEPHFCKEGHQVHRDLSPGAIRRDLELSLKAMGTDYVDVYYTHWQCKTYGLVPVAETMGELLKMKQEGKIRAVGASNVDLRILKDYVAAGQLDVIQEKLSILDRKPEAELLPFCEEHGISLQTYSPIEQGLLAGKASNDYVPKPGEVRDGKAWWRSENIRIANEMLAGWKDLTEKYQCTLANLCIKWNSMLSPNINVLCGARKLPQIEDTARSLDIPLTQEEFLRMKADADEVIARQKL
ncbi:aldo/keto reductase [Clostridium sp. AN503]|uniref:aldo/keto reductase n=1 Tax=Clostridium sp. AN503 TaxID=3160598 RepID=UPI0034591929